MYVRTLSVTDFRSYPQADLELGSGVTAFIGPNGQGKTNLVEAVGYLSGLASHRVSTDAPMVRAGMPRAVVRGIVVRTGRDTVVEVEITPGRANRARVNRAPVTRARDVLGILRTVLFAPEDLALVKGDPDGRRRFLDDLLVTRSPRLAGTRSDYDRVLRQRNALLKSARPAGRGGAARTEMLRTLEVWDAQLVSAGAALLRARLDLVELIGPRITRAYATISGIGGDAAHADDAMIEYQCSAGVIEESGGPVDLAALLAAGLESRRREELDRGTTLVGPHRDELLLRLGPLPARGYASHGESWSFALALRLASFELLREEDPSGDPVLILDDVFAELDVGRRNRLVAAVAGAEQVLVTAAVAEDVPAGLVGDRFEVALGEVHRVGR